MLNSTAALSNSNSLNPIVANSSQGLENQEPLLKNIKILNSKNDPQKIFGRPIWYYLTLGIPILIETLSLFCAGIINRENKGEALQLRYRYKFLPRPHINQIGRFHRYNEITLSILNSSELDKAVEIVNQTIVSMAKANLPPAQSSPEQEKYQSILELLEKNKNPKLSRKHITQKDWKILDLIDFEVAKDYFSSLVDIFNTDWFKNLGFSREMTNRFKIDYQEAVIAESMSMSLAYIEGLGGKTLFLPCFDEQTGLYYSASYTIKEFALGDALPCYIFESEDKRASPWFVIRGTQIYKDRTASMESILADAIDHKGITTNIINKSLIFRPLVKKDNAMLQKESLSDIFENWQRSNKKVIMTGHSLGGTLANALGVEFAKCLKAVYAFGAMGVARKTGKRFEQLGEKYKEKIINFDFEGDFVPSGGHCLIGRHLSIKAVRGAERPFGFYETHVRSHLNRDFQVQQVDVDKENKKISRSFCEKLRVITGRCLRILLYVFGRKYLPDWWKKRKVYKQYANLQRLVINSSY